MLWVPRLKKKTNGFLVPFRSSPASSEPQFGALREVGRHARDREHCRKEPGSALSGGYAPDSVKVDGSSIVDEPGEG